MADKNLRVSIVLQAADKALGPLKKISQGSSETAQTLKAARDQLKQLEQTQRQMTGFQRVSAELRKNNRELTAAQSQVQKYTATLEDQRTRHQAISANLRTAKQAYAQITKAYQDGKLHGEEYTRQIELARISLLANEQAHGRSKAAIDKYKAQVRNATERVSKLGESVKKGQERLDGYKQRLEAAGLSTERLAAQKRAMKGNIDTVTAAIEKQVRALKRQEEQQRKLAEIQKQAQKAAAVGAGMAGAGVASIYAGRQAARPVQAVMGAFSEQENASTQLSASMMVADGSVSKEFAQIDALAKRLGDRLPGTTADFLELMAVLKQQGLADKTILGGTGEAAALLGVQLRMTAPAAGEFAAKMQDATRTAEKDMLSLMDTIQRGYYMGMDSGNMLQGFSKMSPIMGIIRQEGLEFSKTMAPLLVMMDQTGMEGGSAGNAFRKVFQSAMNKDKIDKVLKDLRKEKGIKLDFDFTDGKGEFGGLDKMYAQLEKLKSMNTQTRLSFMKDIWGDDAETLQVLNAMIDKGKAGYEEIAAKMAAQASLQQRVDQQLGTFTNVVEAAQGSATNALASIGEVMAPQLKELVSWLSDVGSAANDWIKENQTLVRWLGMGALALAAFMTAVGLVLIPLGLIVAKGMAMRWIFAKVAASLAASGGAIGLLQGGISRLSGGFGLLLRWGSALFRLNPFAALAAGVFGFAQSFVKNWEKIKAAFNAGDWMAIGGFIIQGLEAGINMATLGLYGFIKSMLSGLVTVVKKILGIHSPSTVFAEIGGFIMDGLILGITRLLSALKGVLVGLWGSMVSAVGSAVSAFVDSIKSTLSGGVSAWLAALLNFSPLGLLWNTFTTALAALGVQVPEQFRNFGSFIMDGLIGGITGKLAALKDTVVGVASSAASWFKERLGIASPSKVFTQFGGWISEGAAKGIDAGQAGVRAAALGLAAVTAAPMQAQASVQLRNAAQQVQVPQAVVDLANAQQSVAVPQASVQLLNAAQKIQVPKAVAELVQGKPQDTDVASSHGQPRLAQPARIAAAPRATAAAPVAAGTSNYNITINAAPGMDAQAIARAVAAELDRRERQSTARRNSSLHDIS